MKLSELMQVLAEMKCSTKDPEIELWISETEKVEIASIYESSDDKKICIDVVLE